MTEVFWTLGMSSSCFLMSTFSFSFSVSCWDLALSAIRISRIWCSHFLTSARSRSLQRAWEKTFFRRGQYSHFQTYMEVIPLPLELGWGVDFVGHDASDGLLNVLHPLGHLCVAHLIDLLDELVVFLPESHLGAGLNHPLKSKLNLHHTLYLSFNESLFSLLLLSFYLLYFFFYFISNYFTSTLLWSTQYAIDLFTLFSFFHFHFSISLCQDTCVLYFSPWHLDHDWTIEGGLTGLF